MESKAQVGTDYEPQLTEGLAQARVLSMTPAARQARLEAYAEGRSWAEEQYLENVREQAADLYPDDQQLQYEYVLGVAQTLNNLARDIVAIDYRDTNQPEGKKRK